MTRELTGIKAKRNAISLKSTIISLPKLMQHMSNPTDNKSHHFSYTCCRSLPKLMQHMSNPTDNKSHHLPYTSVAAVSKTYFEYMTIYKLYSKTMYGGNFKFLQASNAFTDYPTQKNIQHKELADSNNDEISRKKAQTLQRQKIYVDRMDCRRSCCCGCKLENNDARKSGGRVCWNRLTILTILFFVSSVASSVPLPKT